jgi:ERF superfamily
VSATQAELIPASDKQLQVRSSDSTTELMLAIAEAARDPRVDAAKMTALWELKNKIDARAAETAFNNAMREAQDEMKTVVKDSRNLQTNSNYAKLDKIDKIIKPVYLKHGFSLSFNSDIIEAGKVLVSCKCMHISGHSKDYALPGPLDLAGLKGNQNKSDMHALGSSLSYLKRYLKCMIFDVTLTDEDDDGNGGSPPLTKQQLNQVRDLIISCDELDPGHEKKFLAFMKTKSLEDIPQRDFQKAIAGLTEQIKFLKRRRTSGQ